MGAIVFDWDGTLVDTLPAIFRANVAVLEAYGVPFDEARYRAAYAPDWRVMYRRLGVPPEALEEAGARWLELYREAGALLPFEGVERALAALAAAGHRLALVTAGHRAVVEGQLARFGLADVLPVRVCGDDPVPHKPDPAPLLLALSQLNPEEESDVIYVGDAPDDMRMARTVGATGIGIIGALGSAEDLVAAGAAEVWPSMAAWAEGFLRRPNVIGRAANAASH